MSIYGFTRDEIKAFDWWPTGATAIIIPGGAGHDREIVVAFPDNYDHNEYIPRFMAEVLDFEFPETWYLENRGSRIEIHPTGHFAGGFCADDVACVEQVLKQLGFETETRE